MPSLDHASQDNMPRVHEIRCLCDGMVISSMTAGAFNSSYWHFLAKLAGRREILSLLGQNGTPQLQIPGLHMHTA